MQKVMFLRGVLADARRRRARNTSAGSLPLRQAGSRRFMGVPVKAA